MKFTDNFINVFFPEISRIDSNPSNVVRTGVSDSVSSPPIIHEINQVSSFFDFSYISFRLKLRKTAWLSINDVSTLEDIRVKDFVTTLCYRLTFLAELGNPVP